MAEDPRSRQDFQSDFSGGANGFRQALLLAENEVQDSLNTFSRPGGGMESRGGFTFIGAPPNTERGISVFEMDQSSGTVLTHVAIGDHWYDETMQPRYRLFVQTPGVNDAVYFGSREKFSQIILYLTAAYAPGSATQGLAYEYWNGSAWTDFTSLVAATNADAKNLASSTVPVEITLSWPTLSNWEPNQVETRTYQYWIRIRVTVDIQNGASDVVQSQRRILGDWVGRRHLLTAHATGLWEWPGITLTPKVAGGFAAAARVGRISQASLNDYLYYACEGLLPLQRWNGGRGAARSGALNTPTAAGLASPVTKPTTGGGADAASYPEAFVIRHMISYEYGPGGILGESPPSPASDALTIAAGGQYVRVGFAGAKTQANTLEVNAIRIYATRNLVEVTQTTEQTATWRYELLHTVYRDDPDWVLGYWDDHYAPRLGYKPIPYTNTPPFKPKYVVQGGSRIWIANDTTVACSDIGQGDSWNPQNQFWFPTVRGILYYGDRLLVFQDEDISYIFGMNDQSPQTGFLWRGEGCSQPDTICVHQNQVHWVSPRGPARLANGEVELTARNRVWEDPNYWQSVAPQRRLASAVAHDGRIWFGVDRAGSGPDLYTMAALDLRENPDGAWSRHTHRKSLVSFIVWATLGVVHCPLDHPLARQRILCGFADGSYTADYMKLAILEYGTTDNWTTNPYDGQKIIGTVKTRAISLRASDRFKTFTQAHIRHRLRRHAENGIYLQFQLHSLTNTTSSKLPTQDGDIEGKEQDFCLFPTESSTPGRFRDMTPYLQIDAYSDLGWLLSSWLVRGDVEDFKTQ